MREGRWQNFRGEASEGASKEASLQALQDSCARSGTRAHRDQMEEGEGCSGACADIRPRITAATGGLLLRNRDHNVIVVPGGAKNHRG